MDDKQVDRLYLVLDDINDSIARIATVLEQAFTTSGELIPLNEILENIKIKAANPTHEYGDKK